MVILDLMSYALQMLQNVVGGSINEAVCQLSGPEFKSLCQELVSGPNFDEFSLLANKNPGDCKTRNLSAESDSNIVLEEEEFRVRSCPSKPELYLVDGDGKYSVIAYEYIANKFVRIRRVKNLTNLGYKREEADVTEDENGAEKPEEKESEESFFF